MSEFNRYGQVSTLFENVLTYKPHASLRQGLADPELAHEMFADFIDGHRKYHPGVDSLEEKMQTVLVESLDRLIGICEHKMAKLLEQLGGLATRTGELKAIRNNFVSEEE